MESDAPSKNDEPRISLNDRWDIDRGRIIISGTQAIARVLLDQARIDQARGLSTAGYVTGYRGSPLGTVDTVLWAQAARLNAAKIHFQPGVNEDIAATAIRGTQQFDAVPGPRHDGVFAAWYGKGPGVDRSGDALKHGNIAGAHRHGGVVLFYGDDHAAKSSTVAHHSEQAVSAALIPTLYPADVREVWHYGLLGYALSRYSGSWAALKCVTEVVEQTATIDIDLPGFNAVLPPIAPERAALPGLHATQGKFDPLNEERIVVEERLPLVHAFVRANRIDRPIFVAPRPRIGIVTAGKAYGDVRAALALLGLDAGRCVELGISLYKVGCIWPLEATGLQEFAANHPLLFVIEEKLAFLEPQVAAALVNLPGHPMVVGKHDLDGTPLLSSVLTLDAITIAQALRRLLDARGIAIGNSGGCEAAAAAVPAIAGPDRRAPYFCSGCPHNRSTRLPDGSISMTGIGCHTMVNFARPKEALLPTQMGGEGANWIGMAPFTDTPHIFQNMGDGTYYHSGLLAIRAAVAAKVNITYKILYNDAVAMTGGQPIDGPISVAQIAQQVRHEGVDRIAIVSDDPSRHIGNRDLPAGTTIGHRDGLDALQRELRTIPGCTVLIYEQTCAAEKRRRRKRGQMPDPPMRLHIASAVCEGCGDCSDVSTCVSLVPLETPFGRKRAIDQSTCNKDYSCLNGFCPSFVTIHDAEPRRKTYRPLDDSLWAALAAAPVAPITNGSYQIMVAGIGGTGVVTVGAILGMAAHIDGLAVAGFDMTGVSQKNGAVFSHIRIAPEPSALTSARIGSGEADALLAFDLVAALAPESVRTGSPTRTRTIANVDIVPNFEFQFDRNRTIDRDRLLNQLRSRSAALIEIDAKQLGNSLLGDDIAANMLMVGVAAQSGLLPVSTATIEQAIRLNGVAIDLNIAAFRLGRLQVEAPDTVASLTKGDRETALPQGLDAIVAHLSDRLLAYQGPALQQRYRDLVLRVRNADAIWEDDDRLALAVAHSYARLLAYKDEYEVARLLSSPALQEELAERFEAGGRIAFNLAVPLLSRHRAGERPGKRAYSARILPLLRLLARLRWLRGTRLDPFGWTNERRDERALISEYEALVDIVLARLDETCRDQAIRLLGLADAVRGYGPVKQAAITRYRAAVENAVRDLMAAAPDMANDTDVYPALVEGANA